MLYKLLYTICWFFCCYLPLQAQQVRQLASSVKDFEVDNLGNVYILNADQQIKKLNNNFDSIGVYNQVRRFGELQSIDVSNPLRIILWYKSFGTVVLLDRFLSVKNTLDLRRAGILQCNAIAQSNDNNLWLYDELDAKVKKLNEEGTVLTESADFRVLFDSPPHPHTLVDFNRQLFAYDSSRGLLLMDYFGAYKKIISHLHWQNVQGIGKGIVATAGNAFIYLQSDGINTTSSPIPAAMHNSLKIKIAGNRIFALLQNGALVWSNHTLQNFSE